jgi:hypothetical protein
MLVPVLESVPSRFHILYLNVAWKLRLSRGAELCAAKECTDEGMCFMSVIRRPRWSSSMLSGSNVVDW